MQPTQEKDDGDQIIQKPGVLKVKTKAIKVKYKNLKKKSKMIARNKAFRIKKATGKLSYKKISGSKKITIYKNGKKKINKGIKKGTYKIKVKVAASGNIHFANATKAVTVKVVVR